MADLRSGEFLMGVLVGSLVGAAVGLLFAPQPGRDTRELIKEKASQLVGGAKETAPAPPGPKDRESGASTV